MIQIDQKVAEAYPGLKKLVDYFVAGGSEFEIFYEDGLKIVDAEPNKITWEFPIKEKHLNRYGYTHGGLIATLIDTCSSFAIRMSSSVQWELVGVSTGMTISYLKGTRSGSTLTIVCEIERIGNKVATLYTRIYDQNNTMCYSGSHAKFRPDSKL